MLPGDGWLLFFATFAARARLCCRLSLISLQPQRWYLQGDIPLDSSAPNCYISPSNGPMKGAAAMENGDFEKRFEEAFQKMDRAYERYARACGMTYSSLALLQLIWERQPCTQKQLCELTMLPKQTINTIVMSFYKQGLLEMLELPEDRRHKILLLSEKGRELTGRILPKISRAESRSIHQFSVEEKETFFRLLERFAAAFCEELTH